MFYRVEYKGDGSVNVNMMVLYVAYVFYVA